MIDPSNRRQFLHRTSLALGTVCLTAARGRPSPRFVPAGERLNLGLVGVGGHGAMHLTECAHENIVALCDVDAQALAASRRSHPRARVYTDFRSMLDRERLDALLIASADHTHAVIAAAALQTGCHVYCAEPLSRTVSEARSLASLARRSKCITQLGGGISLPDVEEQAVGLVRSGGLGTISEVHAWTDRSHGEFGPALSQQPAPRHLSFETWLGPLFPRPYREEFMPGRWRHWWDFGGGSLSDAGSGVFGFLHRALGLVAPHRIEAVGPALHLQNTPAWLTVEWTYHRKQPASALKVSWNHGGRRSELDSGDDDIIRACREGLLIQGSLGRLLVNPRQAFVLTPGAPPRELSVVRSEGPRSSRLSEWLAACRTGKKTPAGFDLIGPACESMLLGNVAYRTDRRLIWDPGNMIAGNLPDASEYIQHSYRPGWEL